MKTTHTPVSIRTGRKQRKARKSALRRSILGAGIAALLAWSAPLHSATNTWTGATDSLWDTEANWSGGVPTGTDDVAFPGVVPGTGPVITLTNGKLANTLAFSNSYTLGSGSLTLSAGTIDVAPGFTATINSALTFGSGLTKSGTGTLTLSGNNTYTGGTVISSGTLILNNSTAAGGFNNGTITLGNGSTGNGNVALNFGSDITGTDLTVRQSVAVRRMNPVTVANTGSTGTATIAFNADQWFIYTDIALNRATVFTGDGGNPNARVFMGQITGSGAGAGNDAITIDSGSGNWLLLYPKDTGTESLANTFTGNLRIKSGNLQIGNLSYIADTAANQNLVIPDTASVTVDAGSTLMFVWGDEAFDALNGGGTITRNIEGQGNRTLTLGESNGSGAFSGSIQSQIKIMKNGTGTQTFTGPNTYVGGTTINAGTLLLGDGSTLGASLGTGGVVVNTSGTFQLNLANGEVFANTIANSGHVIADDNPNNNYTMSGEISGTGYFTKTGTNTVTLSALNTYTGDTKVQMGTLMAGISTPGGPGATGPGAFGNGSEVYVSNGGILQLNGHHVGIGSLQSGEGQSETLAIVQNSSLTPATLTIGGNNFGYFSGIIQDGPLGLTGRQPSAFEGPLTPAPLSVWKTGNNVQIFAGLNTYTGTTTVNGGILRAGISNAGGIGATGPGAFGNNSAVTVNGTGILQLAGNNVGIGSLSGDAGGIVENSGSFNIRQVSNVQTETQPATLTTGGNNTDTIYNGLIRDGEAFFNTRLPAGKNQKKLLTGPLAIVKTGTGTQIFTGNNTYTGGTTINDGTLAAGSTKAFGNGNLTLNGGVLRTSGGPLAVDIGGGSILFNGGTYIANVGGTVPGTQHDQLKTTGSANISGGFLSLVQQNGFLLKSGSKVVLLSAAGGVAGGTAGGTSVSSSKVGGLSSFTNTPLLVPTVNLYTDSVVLEAMQGSFIINGLTPNQIAVAVALNSLSPTTGGKTGVFKELDFLNDQPIENYPHFLDMIAPEELATIFHLAKSLADIQSSNILKRLEEIRAELGAGGAGAGGGTGGAGSSGPVGGRGKEIAPASIGRWSLWLTGSGEFTSVGSTYNAAGFDLETGGVTVGMDYLFNDHFAAGISLGYMNTHGDLESGGSLNAEGGRIGGYATYFKGGTHVDFAINGGYNSYRIRRVTPNNNAATGSPDGAEVNILLAAGHDWKRGALTFGPTASLQYTNVDLSGYTENGAFAPLSIHAKNVDSCRTSLGFRASYETKVAGKTVKPEVRASWQHEFGDTTYSLNSNFATLGGSTFTVAGPATGRDSLLLGAGVTIQWNDTVSFHFSYDGEVGRKNYESHSVSGGFRIQF